MIESGSGIEYVNAQAEELKDYIDKCAERISDSASGLVFIKHIETQPTPETITAFLQTDIYNGRTRCQLFVRGAVWNTPGFSVTINGKIPKGLRPSSTVESSGGLSWNSGSGSRGRASVQIKTNGQIRISIISPDGNTASGYFRRTLTYYLDE